MGSINFEDLKYDEIDDYKKLNTYVLKHKGNGKQYLFFDEIQNLKGVNFRYIEPNLYLDGYSGQVLIEALVRPTSLADIEFNSEFYPWVKEYALAKAKEIVGRIRSKFTVDSSPYQLDGNTLLSEATAKMAELEQQLIGTIFVI